MSKSRDPLAPGVTPATCGTPQAGCVCVLPEGHETPHVCDCGGSYLVVGDELLVYALPPATRFYDLVEGQDAIDLANRLARTGPVFREPNDDTPAPPRAVTTSRRPIRLIKPPSEFFGL